MDSVNQRLASLGIAIPEAPAPVAAYQPVRVVGHLAFVSGQIPIQNGQVQAVGQVGREVTPEEGFQAARLCGINALAALKAAIGDLDRITGIVRVGVFVACQDDFISHPSIADGASNLFQEVFGEAGKHARAAVGVPSLPLGAAVEVEVVASIAEA